jgi:tripartite-type tricarboxylate transporter receptor subunit TctC
MTIVRSLQNLPIFVLTASIAIALASAEPDTAAAQSYPSRPITMIVPFAAGGTTDVIGRIIADRMRVALGQPIIVENVASASGLLGVERAVRAAPDGYTLSLGTWPTHDRLLLESAERDDPKWNGPEHNPGRVRFQIGAAISLGGRDANDP